MSNKFATDPLRHREAERGKMSGDQALRRSRSAAVFQCGASIQRDLVGERCEKEMRVLIDLRRALGSVGFMAVVESRMTVRSMRGRVLVE